MIGFETIEVTVTVFGAKPILSTDPWIFGNLILEVEAQYEIPNEQLQNIKILSNFF